MMDIGSWTCKLRRLIALKIEGYQQALKNKREHIIYIIAAIILSRVFAAAIRAAR